MGPINNMELMSEIWEAHQDASAPPRPGPAPTTDAFSESVITVGSLCCSNLVNKAANRFIIDPLHAEHVTNLGPFHCR